MTQRDQRIIDMLQKDVRKLNTDELRELIHVLRIELETERRHSGNQRSQIKSLARRLRHYQVLEHDDIINELKRAGSYSMLSPANMARMLRITFDTLEYPCIIFPDTDGDIQERWVIFAMQPNGFFAAKDTEAAARMLNNINEDASIHEYKFGMAFWRSFYSFLEVHGMIRRSVIGGGFSVFMKRRTEQ